MKNLKEFIKSKNATNLPSTKEISNSISKTILLTDNYSNLHESISSNITAKGIALRAHGFSTPSMSESEKEKFSNNVAKIANSDEVLTELSNSLGLPKEEESEDEFVKRGKTILTKILKNKLAK